MDSDVRASITHILTSISGDIDGLDHHKGLKISPSEYIERIFQHLPQDPEKYASHFLVENSSEGRGQFCLPCKPGLHIGEISSLEQMVAILYDLLKFWRDITHDFPVEDNSRGKEPFE